jgi:ABC-type transporter Mla subunit MlaD
MGCEQMRRVWLLVASLAVVSCRQDRGVFYADLPDAAGVREGAVVRYRGIQIGEVKRISFADSVVHLTIRLTRSDVPLRARDGIRLAAEGLFGERTLDVIPGPVTAEALRRSGTLGPAPRDSAADLRREVLEAAAAAALRDMGGLWRRDTSVRDSTGIAPPLTSKR